MSERWKAVRPTFAPSKSSSTVTASRSWCGMSEQASLESASGSIGSTLPRDVDAGAAAVGLAVDGEPGGTCAATSAMWTHTRMRPAVQRSAPSRVVEVPRGRRVDRERGQVAQVARPRPPAPRRRLARLALHERVEAAAQAAVEHQPLEHVARHVRAAEPRSTIRPCPARGPWAPPARGRRRPPARPSVDVDAPAAGEEGLGGEEAAAALEHRDHGRSPRRRAERTAARAVRGARRTSRADVERLVALRVGVVVPPHRTDAGSIPPAAAEVAPVRREVLPHRDVQRAAVGELPDLLEDALAERLLPTTSARSRSCSAPVTISEADAEPPSTSTTTGIAPSIELPSASNTRRGRGAPLVETIVPSPMKMLDVEHGLVEQPAAVVAQVEHDASAPWSSSLSTASRTCPWAPDVKPASRTCATSPVADAAHLALHGRDVDPRALEPRRRALALARDHAERDLGAGRALDLRRRLLRRCGPRATCRRR